MKKNLIIFVESRASSFLAQTKPPQGCQISIGETYQNGTKAIKQTKWLLNIPTSFVARPSKIYPNLEFWFENMPSGNPEPPVESVQKRPRLAELHSSCKNAHAQNFVSPAKFFENKVCLGQGLCVEIPST
jgi:hypothetical protein